MRKDVVASAILIAALVLAGGFYTWVSCIISIVLLVLILLRIYKEKKLLILRNPFGIAVTVVGVFYLLVCLWAVDRGMALFGFFKFLPFPLFLIYLEQAEVDRQKLIRLLPPVGTIVTVLTFVMSQFRVFDLVVTEGRLGGSFQYPNTFAVFLLMAALVALENVYKKDYFQLLYFAILLFGIYQTGSRTVYIITTAALLAMVIFSGLRLRNKLIICGAGIGAVAAAVLMLGGRLAEISLDSSTFLGRLLYYKDGLGIILKHPFGLGYHGYFFVEKQYQTGVYNVLNIHNDVLQLILDIGILPALLFFGVYVYYIVRAIRQKDRCRAVVLSALLLHVFFDYDMQFLSILFLMVLFIDDRRGISREKISGLSRGFFTLLSLLCAAGSVILGISDYLYTVRSYESSYQIYNGNTMSEAYTLRDLTDNQELRERSQDVVNRNQELYVGYIYLAKSCLQEGNVSEYIRYSSLALEKAPFEYQIYEDYATVLIYSAGKYMESGDRDSAKACVDELDRIVTLLAGLEEKADAIAWKINDTPVTKLPDATMRNIRSLKEQLK